MCVCVFWGGREIEKVRVSGNYHSTSKAQDKTQIYLIIPSKMTPMWKSGQEIFFSKLEKTKIKDKETCRKPGNSNYMRRF